MSQLRFNRIVFTLWMILFPPGFAQAAGSYEAGIEAYNTGNYQKALELFKPFAELGDGLAQSTLGLMYQRGMGTLKNDKKAVKWYGKAAEQGVGLAQVNLGFMYDHGLGVQQDYAEAVKWYRMAAEQGEGRGQLNLGIKYGKGHGVSQDYVQAHKWFNLSISNLQGPDRSEAVLNQEKAEKKMTPDQIAEAQKLVREWKSIKH